MFVGEAPGLFPVAQLASLGLAVHIGSNKWIASTPAVAIRRIQAVGPGAPVSRCERRASFVRAKRRKRCA